MYVAKEARSRHEVSPDKNRRASNILHHNCLEESANLVPAFSDYTRHIQSVLAGAPKGAVLCAGADRSAADLL